MLWFPLASDFASAVLTSGQRSVAKGAFAKHKTTHGFPVRVLLSTTKSAYTSYQTVDKSYIGKMSGATLLNEIGWDEGFAIPVANAENKALEDEVDKLHQDQP